MKAKTIRTINDIKEGWGNLIWKQHESETLANERLKVCAPCRFRVEKGALRNICRKCGCYIPAKVRAKRSSCPLKLWPDDK